MTNKIKGLMIVTLVVVTCLICSFFDKFFLYLSAFFLGRLVSMLHEMYKINKSLELTSQQKEFQRKFKNYLRFYFTGNGNEADAWEYVPIGNFEITDFKFDYGNDKVTITIIMGRPGNLIGKGGQRINKFEQQINKWLKEFIDKPIEIEMRDTKI